MDQLQFQYHVPTHAECVWLGLARPDLHLILSAPGAWHAGLAVAFVLWEGAQTARLAHGVSCRATRPHHALSSAAGGTRGTEGIGFVRPLPQEEALSAVTVGVLGDGAAFQLGDT